MRLFKRKLDSGQKRVYNKDTRHCYHCYLEGCNDMWKIMMGVKKDISGDLLPSNEIVKAWDAFQTPRFVKEINELRGSDE